MQIPILSGIYADSAADFRTSYPRNLEPVPKQTGISTGFLRPVDGIVAAATGPGVDRGAFVWNGVHYRVMGSKLVKVAADNTVTVLGDVGTGAQVTMDNGFDRLAIWSALSLFYWDGATLVKVTDPDLGNVIDGCWIGGYFMSTDGESLIVTELNSPTSVNPLKYGSSESDPDPILAVRELRGEAIAFNRYTIQAFQNVGGNNFPFQSIDGALVPKGVVGTHAVAEFAETYAFVGGGKNDGKSEPPSVYLMGAGTAQRISTAEIDQLLMTYSDEQLSQLVLEAKNEKGHMQLLMHLPDVCWVYDLAASQVLGEPAWHSRDSGLGDKRETYRARNLVWVNQRWYGGDPTSTAIGYLTQSTMDHFGSKVAWEFSTPALYNESKGIILHSLELVATPGRILLGPEPTIYHSYSLDGETWSQKRSIKAGAQGQRGKRLQWRFQGKTHNYRIERFQGTSDARVPVARLEAVVGALNA